MDGGGCGRVRPSPRTRPFSHSRTGMYTLRRNLGPEPPLHMVGFRSMRRSRRASRCTSSARRMRCSRELSRFPVESYSASGDGERAGSASTRFSSAGSSMTRAAISSSCTRDTKRTSCKGVAPGGSRVVAAGTMRFPNRVRDRNVGAAMGGFPSAVKRESTVQRCLRFCCCCCASGGSSVAAAAESSPGFSDHRLRFRAAGAGSDASAATPRGGSGASAEATAGAAGADAGSGAGAAAGRAELPPPSVHREYRR